MNTTEVIISYWDWLLIPFYLLIIFFVCARIKNREIRNNATYEYFLNGLFAKIAGAICLCLIYIYYYKEGGDTLHYHSSSIAFVNLLLQNPSVFLKVWLGPSTFENYSYFNQDTGYPDFYVQQYEVSVAKLLVVLELLAFKSYIVASILMAVVSYTGIWKLYQMFCDMYPKMYKQFAISVLFIPSVVFWGSGILKDSWTLAACGWFCYSFYHLFIKQKKILTYSVIIILSALVLILIKPYIFVAVMPGCLIWGAWNKVISIKNYIVKFLFTPFILFLGVGAGMLLWGAISPNLGAYSSIDSMISKAAASSEDLKQEYYHGNSFDIGSYDKSVTGVLSKFPIAVITGLFRPYIWESRNIVMALSGIENLVILFFFFYVFIRNSVSSIKILFNNPLVLFSFIFAIFFAFSVAISTSNFGALVRLKIPLMPFFISGLFIIDRIKRINNIPALSL